MARKKPAPQPATDSWDPGTVRLETTDTEGRKTVTVHSCWNRSLFLVRRLADVQRLREDTKLTAKQRQRVAVRVV